MCLGHSLLSHRSTTVREGSNVGEGEVGVGGCLVEVVCLFAGLAEPFPQGDVAIYFQS